MSLSLSLGLGFGLSQRSGVFNMALGVVSASEIGAPEATIIAPVATGIESLSEVGLANKAWVAIGVESASEVGSPTVTILAPAAVGVESASEVGTIPVDTVAPTMTDDTYDEGTTTFTATLDEDATLHVLVSDTEPLTINDIILGTGLLKTTYEVTLGYNYDPIEFSTVSAGTHWLGILPVDAAGNADFAEAHVAQYVFPGGYIATGVESASEIGVPVVQGTSSPALGVESASEVGTPSATILAPVATGVESTSEVGSASVTGIAAPAATGVESASEIGAPTAPASGLQSDDFSSTLSGFWTFSDPASAGSTASTSSGNLEIAVVDGVTYDINNATNNAPRVLQTLTSDPGDFDIRIRLANNPSAQYQNVGFYIEAGNGDHLRADIYSTNVTIKGYANTTVGTTSTQRVNSTIGSIPGTFVDYVRLTRATNTWSLYTSTDGTNWSQEGSSWDFTMDIDYVGLWAASQGAAGAYTAQIMDFTVV